jgi:PAS domain S-box-containing protein
MEGNTKKQLIEQIESLRRQVAELKSEKTERTRAKELLRKWEEDWHSSFDSLEDVMLIVDKDYNIENMNDAGLALLKKSRDEVIGGKCYKVIAGADSLPEYCPCREASRTKKAASIDRYERRLGRYFSIKSSPIFDENGEIIKFVDLRRDITERKWLEKELRQSGQKYRTFLDDLGDIAYEADLQGNITYANKIAERITGIPLEDIVGKSFLPLFTEESQETALEVYRRTLKGKKPEYELTLRNGKILHFKNEPLRNKYGKIVGLFGIARDITQRKKADEALTASEERLSSLLENIPDFVITVDRNHKILMINRGVPGVTVEQAIGTEVFNYVEPAHHKIMRESLEKVFQTGMPEKYEVLGMGPEGPNTAWYETRVSPNKLDGQIISVTLISSDITARKRAEEESVRLSNAVRMSTDSIVISDLDAKIIDVNEATLKMYGTDDKRDLIGKNSLDLIAPEEREKALAGTKEVLEKGYVTGREYEIITKEGGRVSVEMSVAIMKEADGKPIGFVAVSRDITEWKQADEKLHASEEQYRNLFDSAPEAITVVGFDGTILDVNNTAEIDAGLPREEIIGKRFTEFGIVHEKDLSKYAEALSQLASGESVQPYKVELTFKDKKHRWFEVFSALLKKDDKPYAVQVITRDITEQKRAEEELESGKKKLESYIESMVDGVVLSDLEGTTVDINKACLELLGYKRKEDVVGRPGFIRAISKKDMPKIGALLEEIIKKGYVRDREITVLAQDRREIPILLSATLIKDPQGKPTSIFTVFKDITERKRAEEEITRLSQALAMTATSVTLVDLDGKVMDVNEAMLRLQGFADKQSVLGKPVLDLVAPEQREAAAADMQDLWEKGEVNGEYEIITEDGKTVPVETSVTVMKNTDGKATGLVAITKDITERKKAEAQIRELSSVVEQSIDGIAIGDLEPKLTYVNDAFARIHGYSPAEMVGMRVANLHSEEQMHEFKKGIDHIKTKGSWIGEIGHVRKDGTPFPTHMSVTLLTDEQGKPTGIAAVCSDITERKQHEKEYKQLIDGMNDTIFVIDFKGKFLDVNDTAIKTLGYSRTELLTMGPVDIDPYLSPDDIGKLIEGMKLDERQVFESQHRTKDGKIIPVEISSSPVSYQGKAAILSVARDITERKRAEKKIEHLNFVLRGIRTTNQLITRERDRDRLLKGICDTLTETRGYYNAWIILLHESGEFLTYAESGLGEDFLSMAELLKRGDFPSCCRTALKQSELVVTENPPLSCADCPLSAKYTGMGATTIRLEYSGRVYGLLAVSIPLEFIREPEQHSLFTEVATDIAFALHNIQVEEERKQAEEALQEAKMRFEDLFETANEPIITTDVQGYILRLNKEAEKLSGYSKEELIGQSMLKLAYPEDRGKYIQFHKDILSGLSPHSQVRTVSKTGNVFDLMVGGSAIRKDGNIVEIQCNARDITEAKRAEEKLRESEERYRTILESIEHGYFEVDIRGNLTFFNDSMYKILGYAKNEMMGMNNRQYMDKENAKKVYQTFNKVYTTGKLAQGFDWELIRKDGTKRTVEASVSLVRDSEDKPTGFRGIARDITERKKAAEEIKQARDDYRTITNLTGDIIIHIDRQGRWTFLNDGACKFWGKPRKKLLGLKFTDYLHPDDAEKIAAAIQEMAKIKQMVKGITARQETPKGWRIVEWNAVPLFDETGNYTGMQATGRDITERKQAEKKLQASEEKLRVMFESITDGVIVTDLTDTVVQANDAAARLAKYSNKEELIGRNVFEFVSLKDRALAMDATKKTLEEGSIQERMEYTILTADGREIETEASTAVLYDSSGNPEGIINVVRDITERKHAVEKLTELYQTEAKLRHALEEEMEKRVEFTRALMHELKTPLTPVVASSEMLVNELQEKPDSPLLRLARNVYHGASNLNSRVDELLDLARSELNMLQVQPVVVNPRQLLQEVASEIKPMVSMWEQSLILDLPSSLPLIRADEGRLRQIVLNFITNASKFTPAGGKIILRAREKDANLVVECQDTGPGIAKEEQGRLFDAYHRVESDRERFSGLGLGLALCKKLVELHGGRIWLESEKGKGSTFSFSLPLKGAK